MGKGGIAMKQHNGKIKSLRIDGKSFKIVGDCDLGEFNTPYFQDIDMSEDAMKNTETITVYKPASIGWTACTVNTPSTGGSLLFLHSLYLESTRIVKSAILDELRFNMRREVFR